MMLASSRVNSSTARQAREQTRSPPILVRKPAFATSTVRHRVDLVARQALGSNSTDKAPSQEAQPTSQETQPEQPIGELSLQVLYYNHF
jgi:hypothetical protein